MTVLEVIQRSAEFLSRKGVESARLQAELLLAHVLELPRLRLYLDFERPLTEPELDRVRELVRRRGQREPLQHLVGSTSFCGFELTVNPDVLIPRPETEGLAEQAWTRLSTLDGTEATALDFGTGSGCLAIALAAKCPHARIVALDASARALDVARANAARHGLAHRIEFRLGDGFAAVKPGEQFAMVVANPPYIPTPDLGQLEPEVRDHDPRLALDGGPDGLDFFRRFAVEAPAWLRGAGWLLAEFGDGQEASLRDLFATAAWTEAEAVNDLDGRPRILIVRRAPL